MIHEYTSDLSGHWIAVESGELVCRWRWDGESKVLRVEREDFVESWVPPPHLLPALLDELPLAARAVLEVADVLRTIPSRFLSDESKADALAPASAGGHIQ